MEQNTKKNQKLEKYQAKAIVQINQQLPDQCDIQQFQQCNEKKRSKPKTQGTSKTMLTDQRKTIGIVNLSLEKSINLPRIKKWVSSYLGVKTQILNLNLALYYENNNFYIYDPNKKRDYLLEKNNKDIINAMSILHVLISLLPKNICSLVAIIDQDIFDPYSPDNYIVGRACGNRVCVVQYSDDNEEFYGTIVHELLHTFGFGHCKLGNCIMNRNISECLQLCPTDLDKLQRIKSFDSLQRYKEIYNISKMIGLFKECEWLQKMIAEFNNSE